MSKIRYTSRMCLLFVLSFFVIVSFQNCASEFETLSEGTESLSSTGTPDLPPILCSLQDGSKLTPGNSVTGYPMMSALSPMTCGVQVQRTCLNNGMFDGPLPVYQTCVQQCVHPDNNQAVNAGAQYTYFTRATAASQAECDAARVVSSCSQATGLFAPAVAATRYAACTVQTPMCAYNVVAGTSSPSGNVVGSTVSGFQMQSATYPTLCGASVTHTCQASSMWSGAVPLYTACTQQCRHPDNNNAVNAGTQYTYFTRATGATQAECDAARVVSSCSQTTGLFAPAPAATRYTSCLVQGQTCAYNVVAGTAAPTGNMTGATVTGFTAQTATSPNLCGASVTRTCQANGQWTGAVPLYTACTQQCRHPDNNQAVNAGSQYTYFTKATGASQAECDAARVVSSCSQTTGAFAPAVAATRYAACTVQTPMCAYNVVAGTATPTGTTVGSTVTGFATQSATFPALCGANVTRTCQSSSQWSGAVPVYTACVQKCIHPDTAQPVDAGSQFIYYTRPLGNAAECAAARVVSSCQQNLGYFSPSVSEVRYSTCQEQVVPARVTLEMLTGSDARYNVFTGNCLGCHSALRTSGGLDLTNATQAKNKATVILARMKSVNSPMPTTGLITDTYKMALVEKWVQLGGPADSLTPTTPPPAGTDPLMPAQFSAGSLRVCAESTCPYKLPSQALAAAQNGATIEIMSGRYQDCITVSKSNLIIRGVGTTRPNLHTQICGGKGIIVNQGNSNRFENLEISNFANSEYNGAGFRQDTTTTAKTTVIRNFYFHDGQFGIMGGGPGDRIHVSDSVFDKVGVLRPDGEISVPIFANAGALLEVRKSTFTNAVGGASFIKSRMLKTVIDCSSIAALDTADSYNIDYQTGGEFVLTNSVIQQGTRTENNNMVTINSVSYDAAITNSITIRGNVFLNDLKRGTIINIARNTPPQVSVTGNMFIGGGASSNVLTIDNTNTVLADRPSTIGAYPALPQPGTCTTPVP